jgi:hypothetical protein
MLKERIAEDVTLPKPFTGWRASEIGECETFLCHNKLGHPAAPFSGRIRHLLDDGVMHEHDIVDRLRSKGFVVLHAYDEGQLDLLPYRAEGIEVTGHSDGVIDMGPTKEFKLDYADQGFKFGLPYYLLEVTGRSQFMFQKILKEHARGPLWVKFVQTQFYLHDEEIREYSNCAVLEVKDKNTSELYEEGISYDPAIIAQTIEKVKRVEGFVAAGKVSPFRCTDEWKRKFCRYSELCFAVPEEVPVRKGLDVVLSGESLSEAEDIASWVEMWRRGKGYADEGKEMVEEARALLRALVEQYGVKGLTYDKVSAMMSYNARKRTVDLDALRATYPAVYAEVVTEGFKEPFITVR